MWHAWCHHGLHHLCGQGRRRARGRGCAGPMYQAGTLSGNPLAMVAGIKTLEILARPGAYEHLDAVTGRLINGLLDAGRAAGHTLCGGHISGVRPKLVPHYVRGRCALTYLGTMNSCNWAPMAG